MKKCERCKGNVWADAPPGNQYCKQCVKEILLRRVKARVRKRGWNEFQLVGMDALGKAIVERIQKQRGLRKKEITAGCSDDVLVYWLGEVLQGKKLSEPPVYLCEPLTPRECKALAALLGTTFAYPQGKWTEALDKLELRSPEVRHSLLRSFHHCLSTGGGARFRPPDAILSLLGVRNNST